MPGVDFRFVRQSCTIAEVLDLIGFEPRSRSGPSLRGPCPVHRSQSATSRSFAVHLERNMYHCFRCGSSGNHLDLYAAVTRQNIHDAAVDLCTRLCRDIPWVQRW
jgi:DNA primase